MKILDIISQYNKENIDLTYLPKSIKDEFHQLLSEKSFYELDELKYYPFWVMLMDEDIYREGKFESTILQIQRILDGEKAFEFDTWMKLQKSDHSFLREIWQKKKDGSISENDYERLINVKENIICNTISDILYLKLISLLSITELEDHNTLYCHSLKECDITQSIEYLFEVLEAEKAIHLSLLYNMGKNNFDILIL